MLCVDEASSDGEAWGFTVQPCNSKCVLRIDGGSIAVPFLRGGAVRVSEGGQLAGCVCRWWVDGAGGTN